MPGLPQTAPLDSAGRRSWRPFPAMAALVPGLVLTVGAGLAGLWLAGLPWIARWQINALTIAIVLGMVAGNLFGARLPARITPGVIFSQKKLLRLGVILYGLRITFQDIVAVGPEGLLLDVAIVVGTLTVGTILGRRLLGLERDTALLVAGGSAICGAAAVLAFERVLKAEPGKIAIAVATVVLFGTADLFLYPLLFPYLGLGAHDFGIFTGATVHEVAQVVAVGSAVGPEAAATAVIVKLTRVMLLVPVLFYLSRSEPGAGESGRAAIPWFAVLFVGVAALNSLVSLPEGLQAGLLTLDTLALAAAMAALGLETRVARLRALGPRPLVLAALLWVWLIGVGLIGVHLIA